MDNYPVRQTKKPIADETEALNFQLAGKFNPTDETHTAPVLSVIDKQKQSKAGVE